MAVRISEPIGVAPQFTFIQADRAPHGAKDLAGFGLPDTNIRTGSSTRAGSGVRYSSGTLVLRRNGFLRDPAMLDKLAMDTCAVAGQFASACLPKAEPRPVRG